MTAEWLLCCCWEASGRNFLSSFTLQHVELIYFPLRGCVEFASKYLLENEISQQKMNSKNSTWSCAYHTFVIGIYNYLFGSISGSIFQKK